MKKITVCISGRNEKATAEALVASMSRVLRDVGFEGVRIGIEDMEGGRKVTGVCQGRKVIR